jgi:threonine/homoserine/homoserine lactone efflux protein
MYVPSAMIAALIFVLVFLTLGLSVVFLAFTSGPAGARLRKRAASRRGRRLIGVVVAVIVVSLGVAVPPRRSPAGRSSPSTARPVTR